MAERPASPAASRLARPGWLDGRLVLGVLLVLGSVLAGARVLSSADRSQQVWVAAHDLAPGTVLRTGDLQAGRVRLFGNGADYLSVAGPAPTGYLLRRGIGAHELLPYAALAPPGAAPARDVSVPVAAGHLPADLRRGQQVDVYVSPQARSGTAAAGSGASQVAPRLVLPGVGVAAVKTGGGLASGSQDQPVVLSVAAADVLVLVQAMGQGRIDLVRVPQADQQTPRRLVSAATGGGGPP